MNQETLQTKKPMALRVVFILNALMMILPFVFYLVFTTGNIQIEGVVPLFMIYTGIAYIVSFIALVFFILRRNILGVKLVLFANILIALPASAYIGILVALISLTLVFFNKKIKGYFGI